ncbi:hypothetical protein NEIG_02090 [Nematocida sp. ERTm5]|nr:hypothetical protein NEIG_02090 [Nematocida sp. ERTm5]
MDIGCSIDEVIKRSEAKSEARKQKNKEKRKTEKERLAESEEKENSQLENAHSEAPKKEKLKRADRVILLDRAAVASRDDVPKIEEKELKEVLKIVVKIMNTIPYEPIRINKFQEDGDPHINAVGENHLRKRDRSAPVVFNKGKRITTPQTNKRQRKQ